MAYKNADYKDTYCDPTAGNIRYPSTARGAVDGWAYVFTQDVNYANDLAGKHLVEVRCRDGWRQFTGALPTWEELLEINGLDRTFCGATGDE